MAWSDLSVTSNATYYQLEPTQGFGQNPFGDADIRTAMHTRGFGDPITQYTNITKPTTLYSNIAGVVTAWSDVSLPTTIWA